jgi:hypothetical protein
MSTRTYTEYDGDFDEYSELVSYGWHANIRKALTGKKGRAFLVELEAALVALPEKRLIHQDFARGPGTVEKTEAAIEKLAADGIRMHPDDMPCDTGVCAMGAVALKRLMAKGLSREEAIARIEQDFGHGLEPDQSMDLAHANLKITRCLAYKLGEVNDDGPETPEERYWRVLQWVRDKLAETADKEPS